MSEENSASASSSIFRSAQIFQLPSDAARVRLNEPVRAWHPAVVSRLSELVHLSIGWDGYRGVPVKFENAYFALLMLDVTCPYSAPTPEIVPGGGGDLQIEWHSATVDIEIHVRGPNDVLAWRAITTSGEPPEEVGLTNDFTIVASWIKELMGPSGEVASAAA